LLSEIQLEGEGTTYIIDERGQIIAHKNPAVVLRGTTTEIPEEDARTEGLSGKDILAATSLLHLGEQEFIVIVEQPANVVLKLATDSLFLIIFIMLIVFVLAIGFAVFLSGKITGPIKFLVKSTRAISAGDLSNRIEFSRQDEVGQLASAFNQMASDLDLSRQKAKKHALNLEAKNKQLEHDLNRRKLAEEALRESEMRLKEAQRIARIGNWELDLKTNSLHWSDEVYRIFGLKPQEFGATYESFLDNIHPDDRELVNQAYLESVKEKKAYNIIHRLPSKDGVLKFVNEHCETFYDDDGEAIRSVGTIHDVTEQLKREEELKNSEARYSNMISGLFIGVAIHVDNQIVFANEALVGMLGRKSTKDFLGKNVLDFVHPDDQEMVMSAIQKGLSGEKGPEFIQERMLKGDGSVITVDASAIVIDYYGKSGLMVMINDITEQERAERLQGILYRISQKGNRARTPAELYPAIYEIIQEIVSAKNFYIALYDHSINRLKMVYVNDQIDPNPVITTKNGLTDYVHRKEETFMGTKAEIRAMRERGEIDFGGKEAALWLGIPLISQGKSIGVMAFQDYHNSKAFKKEEKETLELISTPIASAISQQLAQAETHAYARSNALLFEAAQELSETLSLENLYKNLYQVIKKLMDCDTFILSKYDSEKEMIYCDFIIHEDKEEDISHLPPIPLEPEGKGTQSLVIRKGEALIISDLQKKVKEIDTAYYIDDEGEINDHKNAPEDEEKANSLLATPLKIKGEVIGVVQVMSYKNNAYAQEHLDFLQALSFQISLSLNNARLFEQSQEEINLRVQAEEELKNHNIKLEKSVQERTAELNQRIKTVEKMNTGMTNMMQDLNHANTLAKGKTQALEISNEELEAFTYSVSHDLRAPLRHIESFTQLLYKKESKSLSESSQHYLENIISSTQRMRNLIEDLLTLSRTSRVDMHLKSLDPNAIIDSVRAQLFDEVNQRQIAWKIDTLPPILADAGLMKILWENLIGNALKYTRLRKKATIEISTLDSKNETVFYIRDNGTGFPNEYRDRLFIAFERLHKSDDFEGSGIGMAIARRIVERHGGRIWAESTEGKGATFYFSLNINNTVETEQQSIK
jgi:PAS domain S-box-containing protein